MTDDKVESEHFVLRRSTRSKRSRDEWEQQLVMSVRTSRSRGDSEFIPVLSRGGQPSHKQVAEAEVAEDRTQPKQALTPKPYCVKCGWKFLQGTDKFCCECGTPRTFVQEQVVTAPASLVEPAPETRRASSVPATPVVDLTSTPAATATVKAQNAIAGRKYKKRRFRSGWYVSEEGKFIAPDETVFDTRKEASAYHNVNVPKLEPRRRDGWQVYANDSGTHCDWISPDGTKFQSYVSANAYATNAGIPLYGKDGITTGLLTFFSPQKQQKRHEPAAPKPVQSPPSRTSSRTVQPAQPAPSLKSKKPKVFTVPKQTQSGEQLQSLCRKLNVARSQRRPKLVKTAELEIASYIKPRAIKNRMANKVIYIYMNTSYIYIKKKKLIYNYTYCITAHYCICFFCRLAAP